MGRWVVFELLEVLYDGLDWWLDWWLRVNCRGFVEVLPRLPLVSCRAGCVRRELPTVKNDMRPWPVLACCLFLLAALYARASRISFIPLLLKSSSPRRVPLIFASHPCMVDGGGLHRVPSDLKDDAHSIFIVSRNNSQGYVGGGCGS